MIKKKRGVKPGTRRGRYKRSYKPMTLDDYNEQILKPMTIKFKKATEPPKYTPAPVLTLCGQLEDSIMLLETRISNAIAKINSLM